jgi:multiple sugar transport system substrate-binding protein
MAALVVVALAATACSLPAPSSTGAGPDDLVWAVGGSAAAPGGPYEQMVKLYTEQDSSRPEVKLVQLPEAADLQREQMAYELQAQSSTFDILGLDVIWTGEFAVNGWIDEIDDVRGQLEGTVLDSALASAEHQKKLWAVPNNTNAGFLYYRTDLVDEPPKTWDELAKTAKEVGEKEGIGGYVGQGFQYEGLVVNYLEYVWGAGGDLVNDDASEAALTQSDAGTKALEFMQQANSDGVYAPGFNTMKEEEGRNVFQSGDAVFMRNWPYAYALMNGADEENPSKVKDKFDIAPLPTFSGDGTVSSLGGFNLAVNAFSNKKDQAKAFIVWAATDKQAQNLLVEASIPPVRQDLYDENSDDPVMKLLGEVLPQSKPRPPVPAYNLISQDIQQTVFPAYNGDADVGPTIDQLSNEINGELEG